MRGETPGCLGCDPWLNSFQTRMVRCQYCDPDGDLWEPDPNYLYGMRPTAKGRARMSLHGYPPLTEAEEKALLDCARLLGEYAAEVAEGIIKTALEEERCAGD